MRYGIVGMGLMGASYAQRLSDQKETVYGFARRQESIDYAIAHRMIADGTITMSDGLLSRCDTVVLALYPTLLKSWIEENQQYLKPGCLLMDISGVKSHIIEPLQEILRKDVELISTHPMCGRESRGIEHADPTIFNGANYIVVPTSRNSQKAIKEAKALGEKLGCANIAVLGIEDHDRMIGFLSQLTHVIAVSLMNTHDNSHLVEYTGDSFRDLTRIASINEDMWTELFLLNKDILLDETDQFIAAITHFRDSLEKEDTEEMKHLFIQSTARRSLFDK
ncbi:MAG: prephenate dehydrogenase [Erysipelotrichaceae bacterium]|nr:prephenate dehydrogenase [Erysipelotrichaceae bacterium]